MDSRNFEAMTDAEINRWAVLRDEKLFGDWRFDERCVHNYAESADAALALCERWGLEWQRQWRWGLRKDGKRVRYSYHTVHFDAESPSLDIWRSFGTADTEACKFPRALLNAACAAMHAKEMADG